MKKIISQKESKRNGFDFVYDEKYTNEVIFTLEGFMNYLTTLTNISVFVGENNNKLHEVKNQLKTQLKPYFENSQQTLFFGGYIWYFRSDRN